MKDKIRNHVQQDHIVFIRLVFSDLVGVVKSVELPISQLESVINNQVMFDGSSIEGLVRVVEADMYLYPDLATYMVINPEEDIRIASFVCDIYTSDHQPFAGDPRSNLKRVMQQMNEYDIAQFNVGFEPEFYLFKLDNQNEVTLNPNDHHGYFDMPPIEKVDECIRTMALHLEKVGFEIETMHHEVGPGQFEVNFKYDDALKACDRLQAFKSIIKSIAFDHGLYASFMPKPLVNKAGSGMHVNCSFASKEGNNLFKDANNEYHLSPMALSFIAGIMKHADALCALTNPIVNSYKRLIPGYEAPCYNGWSIKN
ncbi:MAG: glutamine synthetase family protein, partial [Bacilli bacterium]